jgi:hypothetical protein
MVKRAAVREGGEGRKRWVVGETQLCFSQLSLSHTRKCALKDPSPRAREEASRRRRVRAARARSSGARAFERASARAASALFARARIEL